MIADKFNVLQMGIVAGERVFHVLDSENYLADNGTRSADQLKGDVAFNDVHFAYKEGQPVLKGISFRLDAGVRVSLPERIMLAVGGGVPVSIKYRVAPMA